MVAIFSHLFDMMATKIADNSYMIIFLAMLWAVITLFGKSMGTSWGIFGMLIPIVTMICSAAGGSDILIPALEATLAGAVYGDHCSPGSRNEESEMQADQRS